MLELAKGLSIEVHPHAVVDQQLGVRHNLVADRTAVSLGTVLMSMSCRGI